MLDFLARVGRVFLAFLGAAGRLALFALKALSHCLRPPFYPRLIARQMIDIGYYSLPVVGLTLPLVSYGGSSLIMGYAALAVLLRIEYENRELMEPKKEIQFADARVKDLLDTVS